RLQIPQHDESPESVTHQYLRDSVAAADRATEGLQVTQQLAETRQMPAAAAGAAVTPLIEEVGRESRLPQLRARVGELRRALGRLRIPVVQKKHGDSRPFRLVRVIHERCPIGCVHAVQWRPASSGRSRLSASWAALEVDSGALA